MGGLMEGMAKQQKEKEDKLQQLNELKNTLGYVNEEQIDERIATLESQMWNQRLSLAEEKKLLSEIAMLSSKKPQVSQFQRMAVAAAKSDSTSESIKQKVEEINEQIRFHKEQ